MSCLVIELRADDTLIVNGSCLRVRNKTRVEFTSHARFLFGKQIMKPEEANTPARRLYFALQIAYAGEDGQRNTALERARDLAMEFSSHTTSGLARHLCAEALSAAEESDGYSALKHARRLIQHEDAIFKDAREKCA